MVKTGNFGRYAKLALAVAFILLAMKGKSQSLEKSKMAVDTLRAGTAVQNISSPDKPMTIFSPYAIFRSTSFANGMVPIAYTEDEKGKYYLFPSGIINKISDDSVTFQTDGKYDEFARFYYDLYGPLDQGAPLSVTRGEIYTMISTTTRIPRSQELFTTYILINTKTRRCVYSAQFPSNSRRVDFGGQPAIFYYDVAGGKYDGSYELNDDGSGFVSDERVPGNLINVVKVAAISRTSK